MEVGIQQHELHNSAKPQPACQERFVDAGSLALKGKTVLNIPMVMIAAACNLQRTAGMSKAITLQSIGWDNGIKALIGQGRRKEKEDRPKRENET
jgi:hypothetical protein